MVPLLVTARVWNTNLLRTSFFFFPQRNLESLCRPFLLPPNPPGRPAFLFPSPHDSTKVRHCEPPSPLPLIFSVKMITYVQEPPKWFCFVPFPFTPKDSIDLTFLQPLAPQKIFLFPWFSPFPSYDYNFSGGPFFMSFPLSHHCLSHFPPIADPRFEGRKIEILNVRYSSSNYLHKFSFFFPFIADLCKVRNILITAPLFLSDPWKSLVSPPPHKCDEYLQKRPWGQWVNHYFSFLCFSFSHFAVFCFALPRPSVFPFFPPPLHWQVLFLERGPRPSSRLQRTV